MLNMQQYKIKAKYRPTKAFRTVRFYGHNEDEALRQLGPDFELPPKSIEIVPQEPPTERQIPYALDLGITVTPDMGKLDVSACIDRVVSRDGEPKPGLKEFADAKSILFSEFIGKKALYNAVFGGLTGIDRTAFFIFCIYRYLSDDREPNLLKSPHLEKIYEIASELSADDRFLESMDGYTGESLRYFGKYSPDGGVTILFGGSDRTIAYKEARSRLLAEGLIPERRAPIPDSFPEIPLEPEAPMQVSKKKGCLASLYFLLIFIGLVVFLLNLLWR